MSALAPIMSDNRQNPGVMIGFDEMASFLTFLAKIHAAGEAERIVEHPLHIHKDSYLKGV